MNQDQYDNWRATSSSGDFNSDEDKKNEDDGIPNGVKVIIVIIIAIIILSSL